MATINSLNNGVLTASFTVTTGNLKLPTTSATVGQIRINNAPIMHTYGTSNLFVGEGAGNLTFTTAQATKNTALGYYALNSITGGQTASDSRNVAVGYGAMRYIYGSSAGYNVGNVAVGCEALGYNPGGATKNMNNVCVGDSAGYAIDSYNVAVGYEALKGGGDYSITSNVAIGYQALKQAVNGTTECVYVGYQAGYSNTGLASYTVAIGSQANYQQTNNANYHTLIGYRAGYGYTTNSEASNICIGYGVVGTANDDNTLRIGVSTGTSSGEINRTFIQGIYGYAGTLGATNCGVIIDSTGQLQTTYDVASASTARTLNFQKARGTGVLTVGDDLGTIAWSGHNGTALTVGAKILGKNKTGSTAANMASQLLFYTKPDSGTAATLRMTIDSTGEITIAAPDSGTGLTIGSGLTVSAGNTTVGTLLVTTVDTNVAAAGVTLSGTTLAADGSDSNINITITPKGTGTIVSAAVYSKAVGGTNRAMLVDDSGLIGNATSSRKFKENIVDMGKASSPIMKLRPVTFNYKADPDKHLKYGLIAEEVAQILPSLVSFDENGEPYTVSYHELPALLLNELQKLDRRIEALEARVDALDLR